MAFIDKNFIKNLVGSLCNISDDATRQALYDKVEKEIGILDALTFSDIPPTYPVRISKNQLEKIHSIMQKVLRKSQTANDNALPFARVKAAIDALIELEKPENLKLRQQKRVYLEGDPGYK